MTNQNVVICDSKSGFSMEIVVSMREPVLFAQAVPKPLAAPGGGTPIIWTKPSLKVLETAGGGGRINAWVDSMRSSSPPRRSSESEEVNKSWMVSFEACLVIFSR